MIFNRSTVAFIVTLCLGAALVFWVILRVDHQATRGVAQAGWQHADDPLSGETVLDPWLIPPDAWTAATAPVAAAIGPATSTEVRVGADVFAVADGVVIFSGPRDGANAVILGHRAVGGVRFESVYAPLAEAILTPGELIGRGRVVGRLGEQPLEPVFREAPAGIERVDGGVSALAEALETKDTEAWMTLEIGNAEKMLELIEEPQD